MSLYTWLVTGCLIYWTKVVLWVSGRFTRLGNAMGSVSGRLNAHASACIDKTSALLEEGKENP